MYYNKQIQIERSTFKISFFAPNIAPSCFHDSTKRKLGEREMEPYLSQSLSSLITTTQALLMVNLENQSQWNESHDIAEPSKEFTLEMEKLHSVFLMKKNETQTENAIVADSSDLVDVVEVRKGFVEHIKPESQNIDVVLDIEMGENPKSAEDKTACELAIVLDISGSMSGKPLQYSKQAITQVIDRLGEEDFLHFVTYSSTSKINFSGFMDPAKKIEAKQVVMNVETAGATNIVSGIQSAISSMFDAQEDAPAKPNNRRLFLFTDGVVNQGVKDHTEIGSIVEAIQRNFSVNSTAFGFGNNFDEALMRLIASKGKGDYFHIDGVEDLSYKINKGLEVLQSLYAINAKLNVFTVNSEQVQVSIEGIHGYDSVPGSAAQASLGDLCFEDLRQVLCSLNLLITGTPTGNSDPFDILQYSLSYLVVQPDGGFVERKQTGTVGVQFSTDAGLVTKVPDSLRVATTLRQANSIDKHVLSCIKNRKREQGISLAKENLELLCSIESIDKTGVVVHLITRARNTIKKLESKERAEQIEKHVGYSAYRGSIVHRKCF